MFFIVYNFTRPSFLYSFTSSRVSSQKSMLPIYT